MKLKIAGYIGITDTESSTIGATNMDSDEFKNLVGTEVQILNENEEVHYLKSFSNFTGSATVFRVSKLPTKYLGRYGDDCCHYIGGINTFDGVEYIFPTYKSYNEKLEKVFGLHNGIQPYSNNFSGSNL